MNTLLLFQISILLVAVNSYIKDHIQSMKEFLINKFQIIIIFIIIIIIIVISLILNNNLSVT